MRPIKINGSRLLRVPTKIKTPKPIPENIAHLGMWRIALSPAELEEEITSGSIAIYTHKHSKPSWILPELGRLYNLKNRLIDDKSLELAKQKNLFMRL